MEQNPPGQCPLPSAPPPPHWYWAVLGAESGRRRGRRALGKESGTLALSELCPNGLLDPGEAMSCLQPQFPWVKTVGIHQGSSTALTGPMSTCPGEGGDQVCIPDGVGILRSESGSASGGRWYLNLTSKRHSRLEGGDEKEGIPRDP